MQVCSIGVHNVLEVSLLLLLNADINFGFNSLGGGSFSFADLAQNSGDGEYAFGSKGRFQSLYLALIIYKLKQMPFAWPVFPYFSFFFFSFLNQ